MKKRKDKLYQKRVPQKYIAANTPKIIYGRTKDEIEQKLDKIIKDKEIQINSVLTLADAVRQWFNEHSKQVKYNTNMCYNASVNEIIQDLGYLDIDKVTPKIIQDFINKKSSLNLKRQTIKIRLLVLKIVYDWLIQNGYIKDNPAQFIKLPKNLTANKREPADPKIIDKINNLDCEYGLLPFFLLYSGLRLGEVLALKYSDIDFEHNTIKVNKVVEWHGNQPFIREHTKSKSSDREVILLDKLKQILSSKNEGNDRFIFTHTQKVTPLTKSQYNKIWRNLNLGVTAHQLRHSFATMLFNAGIDAKTAQNLLGHSSVKVTLDIYTHLEHSKNQLAKSKIDTFLLN